MRKAEVITILACLGHIHLHNCRNCITNHFYELCFLRATLFVTGVKRDNILTRVLTRSTVNQFHDWKFNWRFFFFFFFRKLFYYYYLILITIQLDLTMVAHFRPLPMNENKQNHTSHNKQLNYYYWSSFLVQSPLFEAKISVLTKLGLLEADQLKFSSNQPYQIFYWSNHKTNLVHSLLY